MGIFDGIASACRWRVLGAHQWQSEWCGEAQRLLGRTRYSCQVLGIAVKGAARRAKILRAHKPGWKDETYSGRRDACGGAASEEVRARAFFGRLKRSGRVFKNQMQEGPPPPEESAGGTAKKLVEAFFPLGFGLAWLGGLVVASAIRCQPEPEPGRRERSEGICQEFGQQARLLWWTPMTSNRFSLPCTGRAYVA